MEKKKKLQTPEQTAEQHANLPEGLRSIYLELENFKNIDKRTIDIGGRSILIMGKNGTGKSSLIQAMKSPMDSKIIPSEPIKKGEERAMISHKIAGKLDGEYKEYIMDLHFTPGNKSGRLVITNEKGETIKSPSTMIKTIIGNVSFDITSWMNDKKDKKLQTLKNLTGRGKDIDLCNIQIKTLKDQRKVKNDRATELEGSLNNHGFSQDEIAKYSTPIPMEALNNEMTGVADAQAGYDAIVRQINGFYEQIPVAQQKIQSANIEIERIRQEMLRLQNLMVDQQNLIIAEQDNVAKLEQNCLKGEEWKNIPGNTRPSVIEVSEKIKTATEHNEKNGRIGVLGLQQQEMIKLKGEVEGYKSQIESEEAKRNKIISESQLPVEGLSFDDEDIYYEGLPLENSQQNKALLFDISIDVAMALNPKLKIIFLDDGSLFDKDHLASVIKKIESRGYMAVIELVSEDADVEVSFVEKDV